MKEKFTLIEKQVEELKQADKTGASLSPIDYELIALFDKMESNTENNEIKDLWNEVNNNSKVIIKLCEKIKTIDQKASLGMII